MTLLLICSKGMFGQRLAASRERAGLKQVELAVALGPRYDQAMISRVESGKKQLRFSGAVKAARELNVSLDYLAGLTDDPSPSAKLVSELAHALAKVSELEDAAALATTGVTSGGGRVLPFARPGISPVPLVQNAAIAAGAGGSVDGEYLLSYVPFRDDWLRRHGLNPERCRVIEVLGDSMEPTIENGAVILVDFQRTTRRHGKVFTVRYADGPVVKRLRHDKDGWWLDSDNVMYPSMPWLRDAEVLGQVMWTGRTL